MGAKVVGVAEGLASEVAPTSGNPPLGVKQMSLPTLSGISWQYVPRSGLNDCSCTLVIAVPVTPCAAAATVSHVSSVAMV